MNRGIATFTLDEGKCPKWLFERMVKLGREMTDILIAELGPEEFIRRISDPVWFQSLGTVLAFDWNASGLTTILTAALKEAIRGREKELGIFIRGGKGKTSRKTPDEIQSWGMRLSLPGGVVSNLEYNSRMAAKVDSALVQDGFQIYHHSFFFAFSKKKHPERTKRVEGPQFSPSINSGLNDSYNVSWAVIQQGMNAKAGTARRYHWFSQHIKDLVCEPHSAITTQTNADHTQTNADSVLNLVAKESSDTRTMSVELASGGFRGLMKDIEIIRRHSSRVSQMIGFQNKQGELFTVLNLENTEFKHHPVEKEQFWRSRYLEKILSKLTDEQPENYEKLLATKGVGPKTVRALSLVGEVIYGAKPSYEDPARYSFAFGGKDATPYPIERDTYDQTIAIMKKAVAKSKIGLSEKSKIMGRLERRA